MVRTLALVVVALVSTSAHAQGSRPYVGPDKTVQRFAEPLGCQTLTMDDRLPHSNVKAIVQDKRGFIWLGTQNGLARYDGITMRVYRPSEKDPKTISSGDITSLVVDTDGKLWATTGEHGVNLYDPDTDDFTQFKKGDEKGALSSEGVTHAIRDKKDRIWFAMSGGGLNRFDPVTRTFIDQGTKPLDAAITAMSLDAAGNLWLGTANGDVIKWNPDSTDAVVFTGKAMGVEETSILSVLATSTGKILVGTDGEGVGVLDPTTKKATWIHTGDDAGTITDDHVSVLFEDKAKNIWIGTHNGLNRMRPDGSIAKFVPDPEDNTSLSFPRVDALFEDAGGVMWAGGFTVGVCKIDEFRQQFGLHRIRRNFSTAFYEDTDGTLWVGTYNNGLYKYERKAGRVTIYHELRKPADGSQNFVSLESQTWISSIHRDKRGTLWLANKGRGLIAFDTTTETFKEYLPDPEDQGSLPVDSFFDIHEDDQGILWLASWGSGLVRFDPVSGVFSAYMSSEAGDDSKLTSNHLYALYPDPKDRRTLWVGTTKGGLVRFNLDTGTATSFHHKPEDPTSISSDHVASLYVEPSGIVWMGTYGGGLSRLDPTTGKAENYTTSTSKLTNDDVLGLLPGDDGKLWMSTNGGGILSFDPKEKKFTAYTASDGLQDNEFNIAAYMRGANGDLYFGGGKGFNAFNPKNIKQDKYVPPIVLTSFKLGNQEGKLSRPIWTLPTIEVKYTDSFEIQFAALAFAAPEKIKYAYKLKGYDKDFTDTDRPFAAYRQVRGGSYTLIVKATNRHGVESETPIELSIRVKPPIWQTWQAFIVYLVLLAAAVLLVIRYQRERVRRAEREGRLKIVEHDLALTGAVQNGFLPEVNEISNAHIQVFGLYRPADACSGDWWWHETLSGGRHVIMVGDVTGHGPGPAMVTAAVATAFRVLMENGLDDPERGLELLNKEVLRVAKGKYHMTMAALEIDEATGRWVFHSAGAPPIMSLNQAGKHRVHFCPGAPLGTENGFEIGRVEGQLKPTERIMLYTDGIPEINLPNGNQLGMRRFAQLYERTRGQHIRDASATILQHALQSKGNGPQHDDWTFAIVEWGQPS